MKYCKERCVEQGRYKCLGNQVLNLVELVIPGYVLYVQTKCPSKNTFEKRVAVPCLYMVVAVMRQHGEPFSNKTNKTLPTLGKRAGKPRFYTRKKIYSRKEWCRSLFLYRVHTSCKCWRSQ